jgi:hypothetical protein
MKVDSCLILCEGGFWSVKITKLCNYSLNLDWTFIPTFSLNVENTKYLFTGEEVTHIDLES